MRAERAFPYRERALPKDGATNGSAGARESHSHTVTHRRRWWWLTLALLAPRSHTVTQSHTSSSVVVVRSIRW